jgi:Family of unknown function (DUF6912)
MRIYVPCTFTLLRQLLVDRALAAPLTAFAVTPGLREWYVDDDGEALEYAAMSEAARASLRLLDADPGAARRRVVLAADVPEAHVRVRDDLDRGVVTITASIALADIASVHADDPEAESTVTAGVAAIDAADLGDEEAEALIDDVEGFELAWFATQEIEHLLD